MYPSLDDEKKASVNRESMIIAPVDETNDETPLDEHEVRLECFKGVRLRMRG
jgi:hypothetical protein